MKKGKQLIYIIIVVILIGIIYACKGLLAPAAKEASIVISEVCIHNDTAAYDDNGNYGADYIELYNPTDEPINLLGWGLSDKKHDLYRFVFPSIVIYPEQCIICWCSENIDDVSCYRDDYIPTDVHGLEFKISSGEQIILTDNDRNVVSSVSLPGNIDDNLTFSTSKEHLAKDYYIAESTPYYVENTKSTNEDEYIEQPTFSLNGGWFDNAVSVEIFAQEGDIYYTIDGSDPDEEAMKYEGPITITNRTGSPNIYAGIGDIATENAFLPNFSVDKGTVLKAICVDGDKKSKIAAQSFFVGLDEEDYSEISIMSISFSPDDFFGYSDGIYVKGQSLDRYIQKMDTSKIDYDYVYYYPNYAKSGRGWEREVQVEYFSEDHQKLGEQNVGIRIHGGWSVSENQKSFNIYSRPEYDGNENFTIDFWDDEINYDKLMLRTGGQGDSYHTKMRDFFCQSLVSDRNIGIQKAKPCIVFLNGEYWGLYNLQETIGTGYIRAHYGVAPEDVVIIKNGELKEGEEEYLKEYNDLLSFICENDISDEMNYKKVEEKIDIQSMIDYYAFEIYVGNVDAFSNNVAIWRSKKKGEGDYEDCKWRWLAYDIDESCGLNDDMCSADIDSFVDGHWRDSNPIGGDDLFSALIQNPDFKMRFVNTFIEMAENNFNYEDVSSKLQAFADLYSTAVINSQVRFRGDYCLDYYSVDDEYLAPYDEIDYRKDIDVMDEFFRDRAGYITNYMYEDLGITN